MKTGFVYVLLSEDDFYYIGFSRDIQVRICSHFCGAGSKWTQLHKPIDVICVKEGCTLLETLTTLVYMIKYGFEKVRGGSYTTVDMKKPPVCLTKARHYAAYYK